MKMHEKCTNMFRIAPELASGERSHLLARLAAPSSGAAPCPPGRLRQWSALLLHRLVEQRCRQHLQDPRHEMN